MRIHTVNASDPYAACYFAASTIENVISSDENDDEIWIANENDDDEVNAISFENVSET